ncbi:hypothetical protein SmJEL517_g05993 [Synchytrium microbalum]|uniref:Histidine biosynthesis trifunctional protein n=1 Tax=Synchytrium microbalum TaxID=1806994 RepID=A0A507BYV0_9FUNG|nr:uncharacterized protein SmJEL517_g05993 [Synchytrium microbalum]TPX30443.1 hypothetical protein SmJEL517_g05993 [Synchytrium microbalum]
MLLTSITIAKDSDISFLKNVIRKVAIVSDLLLIPEDASVIPLLLPLLPLARFWVVLPANCDTSSTASQLLDGGASRIVFQYKGANDAAIKAWIQDTISASQIPSDRVAIWLDGGEVGQEVIPLISEYLNQHTSAYIITLNNIPSSMNEKAVTTVSPDDRNTSTSASTKTHTHLRNVVLAARSDRRRRHVAITPTPASEIIAALITRMDKSEADIVLPYTAYSNFAPQSHLDLGEAFASCLVTDRSDGLFPTVVVDEHGIALGMAYSSVTSIAEAVKTGQGVYQSRSRGLWHKGLTSGATQLLYKIDADCDKDTVRFVVHQTEPGFCHLNTRTCFGPDHGITALDALMRSRKISAPEGSYTKRLFDDSKLLRSKIMEEAEELCDAVTPEEVAAEAADLIYFALVKCTAAGVSLADVERELDAKAKKVTRRPGNGKPKWEAAVAAKLNGLNNITGTTTTGAAPAKADQPKVESSAKAGEAVKPAADGPSKVKPSGEKPSTEKDFKLKSFVLADIPPAKRATMFARPIMRTEEVMGRVKPIVDDVKARGDAAILDWTLKFDGVKLESPVIKAPFDPAMMVLPDKVKAAIDQAFDNIYKFHKAQLSDSTLSVETMPGVVCSRFVRPIEKVGLYVPGGTAVLPSSTLMLGIPAMVAGCSEIVIATPPRKDGSIVPEVLYVAHKVGASMVVTAGGAQAVAGMAYGTASIPKVDKICGPGNQYVTSAKMLIQNDTSALLSIDMPAGPSEVLVIADSSANPAYVASDLLSQAEHGTDSQVVLVAVALGSFQLSAIEKEVAAQGAVLPRAAITREAIRNSFTVCVGSVEEALEFSNSYAPEHLIMQIADAESYLPQIKNAGSVFVGPWSAESCGDYASGTNHTLPTYGFARMYSGVNTHTFVKHITSQNITAEGLDALGDTVMTLAEVEGLEAHRNAVALRLNDIRRAKAMREHKETSS